MTWLDTCLETAQKVGALSSSAILALICIAQGYFIHKKESFAEDSNERWRLTREGQIRAEEAQTSAQEKSSEVIAMNTTAILAQNAKIDHLATIIEERIPRKGG